MILAQSMGEVDSTGFSTFLHALTGSTCRVTFFIGKGHIIHAVFVLSYCLLVIEETVSIEKV